MEIRSIPEPAQTAAVTQPSPPPDKLNERRELIRAVRALNATELFGQNNELTFVLDPATQRPLVRIVDRKTREVIRQIPPEYALRMAEDLSHNEFM